MPCHVTSGTSTGQLWPWRGLGKPDCGIRPSLWDPILDDHGHHRDCVCLFGFLECLLHTQQILMELENQHETWRTWGLRTGCVFQPDVLVGPERHSQQGRERVWLFRTCSLKSGRPRLEFQEWLLMARDNFPELCFPVYGICVYITGLIWRLQG